MDTTTVQDNRELAAAKKRALDAAFYRKGIAIAALSSCMYALYTAFVTAGQLFGVWVDWFGTLDPTSLLVVFILPTIASGINDTLGAVWATLFTVKQGKIVDLGRCIASKPGIIVVAAAALGGPIASASYVIALSQAGTLAVPIAALNPAIGAILACIFYKQPIGPRVGVGIGVCALAGAMIGGAGLGGQPAPGRPVLGYRGLRGRSCHLHGRSADRHQHPPACLGSRKPVLGTACSFLGVRRIPWAELHLCRPCVHGRLLDCLFRLLGFCRLFFVYELVSRERYVRHGAGHGH